MYFIRRIVRDERAATAIEYGLLAALIAIAAITALRTFGTTLATTFNNAASAMTR